MAVVNLLKFGSLLLLLLAIVNTVGAIKCFECSSNHIKDCGEPFLNSSIVLSDCMQSSRMVPPPNSTMMCRTIRRREPTNDWVYVRSCAWVAENDKKQEQNCVRRNETAKIETQYCICDDRDGCNDGACKDECSGAGLPGYSLTALMTSLLLLGAVKILLR